jgi:hypothetical protein
VVAHAAARHRVALQVGHVLVTKLVDDNFFCHDDNFFSGYATLLPDYQRLADAVVMSAHLQTPPTVVLVRSTS